MVYCEMITESKTWVCPRSGRWKIICVGGGSSGGRLENNAAMQNAGGTTSFGNILSAAGGKVVKKFYTGIRLIGGQGGYTGINYGGAGGAVTSNNDRQISSSAGNGGAPGTPGIGYGAGGGSSYSSPIDGGCGELKSIELDLAVNQSIVCTIGTGGAAVDETTAGNPGVIVVRFIQ